MALITGFTEIQKDSSRVHKSTTVCGYLAFSSDGSPYLELNTYASGKPQDLSRPKQLLQFDERGARELMELLKRAFPKLDQ